MTKEKYWRANMAQIPDSESIIKKSTPSKTASAATKNNRKRSSDEMCERSDKVSTEHQYSCPRCRETLNREFNGVLRGVMLREGWTKDDIKKISLQQFARRSMAELIPDPAETEEVRIRLWGWNCVQELQARIDASREMHKARTEK